MSWRSCCAYPLSIANFLRLPDQKGISWGEQRLQEQVWTQRERREKWVALGHDISDFPFGEHRRQRRRETYKANRAARRRAHKASENEQTTFGEWEGTKDAIGDVEEEIEFEDTMAAFRQTHVGVPKPWEEDVADRTKE